MPLEVQTREPVVMPDQEDTVEVIRPKTPAFVEEKKEEHVDIDVPEKEYEEEGLEALWVEEVEEETVASSPASTIAMSPVAPPTVVSTTSTKRRNFFFRKINKNSSSSSTTVNNNSNKAGDVAAIEKTASVKTLEKPKVKRVKKVVHGHVQVLEPVQTSSTLNTSSSSGFNSHDSSAHNNNNNNNIQVEDNNNTSSSEEAKQPTIDTSKEADVSNKVNTARLLLDQALAPGAQAPRELAGKAFAEAAQARAILGINTSSNNVQDDVANAGGQKSPQMLQMAADYGTQAVLLAHSLPSVKEDEEVENETFRGPALEFAKAPVKSPQEHALLARRYLEFVIPESQQLDANKSFTSKNGDEISTLGFDNTYFNAGGKGELPDILSMSSLNEILDGPSNGASKGKTEAVVTKETPSNVSNAVQSHKKDKVLQEAEKVYANIPPQTGFFKQFSKKNNTPTPADIQKIIRDICVDDGTVNVDDDGNESAGLVKYQDLDEDIQKKILAAIASDENESVLSIDGVKIIPSKVKAALTAAKKEPTKLRDQQNPSFVPVPPSSDYRDLLQQKSWESHMENEAAREKDLADAAAADALENIEGLASPMSTDLDKYSVNESIAPQESKTVKESADADDEDEEANDEGKKDVVKEDKYSIMFDMCDTLEPFVNNIMCPDHANAKNGSVTKQTMIEKAVAAAIPTACVDQVLASELGSTSMCSEVPSHIVETQLQTPGDNNNNKDDSKPRRNILKSLFGRRSNARGNHASMANIVVSSQFSGADTTTMLGSGSSTTTPGTSVPTMSIVRSDDDDDDDDSTELSTRYEIPEQVDVASNNKVDTEAEVKDEVEEKNDDTADVAKPESASDESVSKQSVVKDVADEVKSQEETDDADGIPVPPSPGDVSKKSASTSSQSGSANNGKPNLVEKKQKSIRLGFGLFRRKNGNKKQSAKSNAKSTAKDEPKATGIENTAPVVNPPKKEEPEDAATDKENLDTSVEEKSDEFKDTMEEVDADEPNTIVLKHHLSYEDEDNDEDDDSAEDNTADKESDDNENDDTDPLVARIIEQQNRSATHNGMDPEVENDRSNAVSAPRGIDP